MATHPIITPTCADHRRRWHDLGGRGWADHAALQYPHGHRVALGDGGVHRLTAAKMGHEARADDAVCALLARDPAQYADPDDPRETGLLLRAMRAAGQDDACRRLLARDPVGHGQLYQAARCRLRLVEGRGHLCGPRRCCWLHGRPSRGGTGTAAGSMAARCSGAQRRLTDA
jgi:hypothetical protein